MADRRRRRRGKVPPALITTPTCADCGAAMRLVTTRRGRFYGCTRHPLCDGAHGAFADGRPVGIAANKATRHARTRAHAAFDRLWRDGQMTRKQAYAWLAGQLGMTEEECHLGKFDHATCRRVVEAVRALEAETRGRLDRRHERREESA